jgi:hypothetical protein
MLMLIDCTLAADAVFRTAGVGRRGRELANKMVIVVEKADTSTRS